MINRQRNGADMTGFGSAELGHATQLFIAQMDQRGKNIRRDEWEFDEIEPGKHLGIRINYAYREQYIDLLYGRILVQRTTVNLDSTNPQFPTLEEVLHELREVVVQSPGPPINSAIRRTGE